MQIRGVPGFFIGPHYKKNDLLAEVAANKHQKFSL